MEHNHRKIQLVIGGIALTFVFGTLIFFWIKLNAERRAAMEAQENVRENVTSFSTLVRRTPANGVVGSGEHLWRMVYDELSPGGFMYTSGEMYVAVDLKSGEVYVSGEWAYSRISMVDAGMIDVWKILDSEEVRRVRALYEEYHVKEWRESYHDEYYREDGSAMDYAPSVKTWELTLQGDNGIVEKHYYGGGVEPSGHAGFKESLFEIIGLDDETYQSFFAEEEL